MWYYIYSTCFLDIIISTCLHIYSDKQIFGNKNLLTNVRKMNENSNVATFVHALLYNVASCLCNKLAS